MLQQELTNLRTITTDDRRTNEVKASVKWSDFTTKTARKALAFGFILIGLYAWHGIYGLSAYLANIFETTGSPLSPNMSAIVLAALSIFGAFLATMTVDRFGRKVFSMN